MYSVLYQIYSFLNHYFKADTSFSIHSPFLYEISEEILSSTKHYYAFDHLDALRKYLLKDNTPIDRVDLGAGSKKRKAQTIADVTRTSVSSDWQLKILFHLILHFKPDYILELGTSVGLSTAYMAMAHEHSRVISIEGDPALAQIARDNLDKLGISNVEIITGNFDEVLPSVLANNPPIGLSFIDGNHSKIPTLKYLDDILKNTADDGIIIMDDIHWSEGMAEAWEQAIHRTGLNATIDLYFFGLLLKNKDLLNTQHLRWIPSKWKPIHKSIFFP